MREQLKRQCKAEGVSYKQLKFDMPVRWDSTAVMLSSFLALRIPITSVLAVQQVDRSLRNFILLDSEWEIINNLLSCFNIFVKISMQMQSESVPTLNWVIPYYLAMIRRLEKQEDRYGSDSPIGKACMLASLKLLDYFDITKSCNHSKFAMILDPRFNLAIYEQLLPNGNQVKDLKTLFV